jgi:LPS-assembly protein
LKDIFNCAIVPAFIWASLVPTIQPKHFLPALVASGLAAQAGAQGICLPPGVASTSAAETLDQESAPSGVANRDPLQIEAGTVSGGLNAPTELGDGISFRYRDGAVTAERARVDPNDESVDVIGRVTFENDDFSVFADDANYDRDAEQLSFGAAGFNLPKRPARGRAEQIQVTAARQMSLANLSFTTCPEDDVDWEFLARELELDTDVGFGRARGVKLRFKGVPILYTPYFTFPIDDQRKSGFLTPNFAERERTGLDLTMPYYLNLAPNYDLTLEPRYMSKRGLQIASDFRYLLPRTQGTMSFEFLPDDNLTGTARRYVNLQHQTLFTQNWQLVTGIEEVSDSAYFEDMGESLSVTSLTHLNRFFDIGYFGQRWSLHTRLQNYQTIDAQIAPVDQPYERVPQMLFEGHWGSGVFGFMAQTELVNFDRDVGVTGWRFDSTQELSLRFGNTGAWITPAVAIRQTNYWLDDVPPGDDDMPTRQVPISSIDSGLRFERAAGSTGKWIQTLEPRALYVRIPYEDQSRLPVFDTIVPDFNLVQLFRKYQFVGPDRIADTDQISVGLTTRLLDESSGQERISATLGQTRYQDPQQVTLPNQPAQALDRSDYVAELVISLSTRWNLDLGYQWNDRTNSTVRAETRIEYRPQEDRLFGFGYRQREGILEQGDLSLVWPVGDSWRVIGQYSYSLLEEEPLEQFLGLEYEACCWRVRLVGRRYIIRSTGETDSTISIQLELKGLSQRATAPEELLDRGILGYRSLGGPAAQ